LCQTEVNPNFVPTTSSLAGLPSLQHINNNFATSSVKDILGIEECGRVAKKGEKPLQPVDFVTVIPGTVPGDEDILNHHEGIELVIRTVGAKKRTPDRLSTGQYIEASSLILQLLLPTITVQELTDYVE
jgi:hypothetical protein